MVTEAYARRVREATAIVDLMQTGSPLIFKICPECGEQFATNRDYMTRCSDECLQATLEKLGLIWNPEAEEEDRWQAEIPALIEPTTLAVLKNWAREILRVSDSIKQLEGESTIDYLRRLKGLK